MDFLRDSRVGHHYTCVLISVKAIVYSHMGDSSRPLSHRYRELKAAKAALYILNLETSSTIKGWTKGKSKDCMLEKRYSLNFWKRILRISYSLTKIHLNGALPLSQCYLSSSLEVCTMPSEANKMRRKPARAPTTCANDPGMFRHGLLHRNGERTAPSPICNVSRARDTHWRLVRGLWRSPRWLQRAAPPCRNAHDGLRRCLSSPKQASAQTKGPGEPGPFHRDMKKKTLCRVYTAWLMRERSLLSRREKPVRNSSTLRAHSRPSLMAQTTRDWPRRMSPAVKILAILVW